LWVIKSWGPNRRTIPQALAQPEFGHLRLIELTRPDEALHLADQLAKGAVAAPS
jgi:hypothetical protein